MQNNAEKATFGGGCFWCTYAMFNELRGVSEVVSGYSGDESDTSPTYEKVCKGESQHAEVVQVTYDPSVITYKVLLKAFFYCHDPCSLNKQGEEDIGPQYRSIILYHTPAQKQEAEEMIVSLNENVYAGGIVTLVQEFKAFYPAEDYHQNYFALHPDKPYCALQINPKFLKFLGKMKEHLKAPAVAEPPTSKHD